jgi:hypothetical protein
MFAVSLCHAQEDQLGTFSGRVVAEWLVPTTDNAARDMRLVEPFAFRDSSGTDWNVPSGTIINGASIPQILWSLAGSPFTGNYRRASVIHDHYCATKERPWRAVHRVFYDAMRADGVGVKQAKIYYAAVYGGGPRWSPIAGAAPGAPKFTVASPRFSEESLRDVEQWIEASDPALDEIENRVDERPRP